MSEVRSNIPTIDEALPRVLVEQIVENTIRPLNARADELIEDCRAFTADCPTITSDEQDAEAAEILGTIAPFVTDKTGRVDRARIALKAPILAASEIIDGKRGVVGPFAAIVERVGKVAAPIRVASIAYKQEKADRIRKAAQIEAARQTAEARMAEQLASKGSSLVTFEDAARAQEKADDAWKIADAKPAELTRSHGDAVGISSLRYKRVVTITAPHLIPRQYCMPSDTLLRAAAGAAESPIPAIPGCEIVDVPDLTVRR